MSSRSLRELIQGQQVRFVFYRDGNLWYQTDSGFEFPIPLEDVGAATFMASDKAILFMRWIRRHLEVIEKAES